ncbi:MAG: prepilin-type N-terminal cleavage/methylation domain-containing protein [Parasphingorhabdus sp.]|jgi:prepilin-type N-terminal cleavage/methylation domain-containing protein|tara:strand:- start:77 stop:652 length:576 start_codon:yes stop_codon:yes gene_type:complete
MTGRREQGFTLIEIMVVVMIIATMSAISLLALNQASDRRYETEADKLLIWLQQISERASLEGAAYGIVPESDPEREGEATPSAIIRLRVVVYYRMRWVAVSAPEPFLLEDGATVHWLLEDAETEELMPQGDQMTNRYGDEIERLLPEMAFLPDGYIEPKAEIVLSFDSFERTYVYLWNDDTSAMALERRAR